LKDYKEIITDMLVLHLSPDQICEDLRSCPKPHKTLRSSNHFSQISKDKKQPPSCWKCEIIINTVEHAVIEKGNKDQIATGLNSVCAKMPQGIQAECKKFIQDYKKSITDMLVNNLSPDQICESLKSCPQENEQQEIPIWHHFVKYPVSKPQPPLCWKCEIIINSVDQMVEDKGNEDQIKTGLAKVCSQMPKDIQVECKKFLTGYQRIVTSMLVQNLTPDQICQNLGSCPKESMVWTLQEEDQDLAEETDDHKQEFLESTDDMQVYEVTTWFLAAFCLVLLISTVIGFCHLKNRREINEAAFMGRLYPNMLANWHLTLGEEAIKPNTKDYNLL